jgi:hypothetical protein
MSLPQEVCIENQRRTNRSGVAKAYPEVSRGHSTGEVSVMEMEGRAESLKLESFFLE